MSRRRRVDLDGSWEEAIAAASGRSPEQVSEFLTRFGLRPQSLIPHPTDLTVRRVEIRGEKRLQDGTVPFDFVWDGLGPGIWLLGSAANSKGKTSLIGVIRWMLRGTPPDSIPPGVLEWIHQASLEFDVGDARYRVSLNLQDGYSAELVELTSGSAVRQFLVESPTHFADAMSDFMLGKLNLEPMTNMRRARNPEDDKHPVAHAWPALFGAFHIGTDYRSLLGDHYEDGLPNRMLNMFAGFPHASAVAGIKFALATLEVEQAREDRVQLAVSKHAAAKLERLRAELTALGALAPGTETATDLLESIRTDSETLAGLYARLSELRKSLAEAEEAAAATRHELNSDRKSLQNYKEARAAAIVFRALDPRCCPRCDRTFGAERKDREREEHTCAVCGEAAPTEDAGDPEAARASLEQNVDLSTRADAAARAARDEVQADLSRTEARISELEARIESQRKRQRAAGADESANARRAILEAMITETERDVTPVRVQSERDDHAIAAACEKLFTAQLKSEQEEVLAEVEAEMLALLRQFGVANLEGVKLTSNPHLLLVKGATPQAYGKSSEGDKLRSKIALVVALMKVAHRRGIGRHPGLLFIDTPGAQETVDVDLAAFADGLAKLRDELPTLQLFLATTKTAEFARVVPPECALIASGDDTVW